MPQADFVHLHVHTNYSLLDGACKISDLVKRAADMQFPSMAMTDHGNLFGAIEFYGACKKAGIKPIIGVEAYLAPKHRTDRSTTGIKDSNSHIVLLARDEEGYANLRHLVTSSYLEGFYYKPRIDKELLSKHGKGLIALTSCLKGVLNIHLTQDQPDLAGKQLDDLTQLLGTENVYIELQRHGLALEDKVRPMLAKMAKDHGLKTVATNDVHYLTAAAAQAHDALMAIQTQTTIDDPHRLRYEQPEFYLKSPEQMKQLFAEHPDSVSNTLEIAERCNLNLEFGKPHLPSFEAPAGKTQEQYLRELCHEGLQRRYPAVNDTLLERLQHELSVIQQAGYTSYFLIVWDFVKFAKDHGIPVGPGRGSAAGSLVSYCLAITDIDPLKYDLLFERFLNPQRVSLPDIDIDFCYERRGEVIDYVVKKYGQSCVAQIITFGTMQAKAVVRDVGRVMKMSYADVDRLAKLIPYELDMTLKQALEQSSELAQLYKTDEQVTRLIDTAMHLEGLTRHASTHAAGIAITDRPLVEHMPLYKSSEGLVTTGYEMGALEKLGLLKIDLLGLRTLTVIKEAVDLIKQTRGATVDLDSLTFDDPATYALLARADTIGVFQLESGGMRDLLRKLNPTQFEDLIAILALYRPGPIGSGMLEEFIKRKHGQVPIKYDHPRLEPILKQTYGVCLSGDTTIEDVRTGITHRLDKLSAHPDLVVQAIDSENCPVAAPVVRVIDNGTKSVYRVRLRNGFELKMTSDHRVLAEAGWKPLYELSPGDYIAIPRRLMVQSEEYDIRRLRVLAYLIADGDLSNKSSVHFISKDPELLEDFQECVESFELVQTSQISQIRGVTRLIVSRPRRSDVAYHTPSGLLAFLRKHGLKNKRGGLRSWEKFIPPFAFALIPDHLAVFVAALWDCDGFVGRKICHYVTTSPRLAHDVQFLLLKLGIASTIYTSQYQTKYHGLQTRYQVSVYDGKTFAAVVQPHMKSKKRFVQCLVNSETTISREAFLAELRLVVPNESQRALQRRLGIDRQHFSPRRRRCPRIEGPIVRKAAEQLEMMGSLRLLRLRWEPIEEIRKIGVEHVYDLEVAEMHNFVANGIIVHNCVYQEQVMRIASDLGGFTLAQADLLRRAMGKKISEVMESQRKAFLEGCKHNHITDRTANRIFDLMEHFANYGFNKSHSAAYAVISYRTAYLKAHYPVEFMAALLTSEMGNTDKLVMYLDDARRMGITVLPPDVNESEAMFTVGENTLRCGLAIIKNVGLAAIESVVKARQARGRFNSIAELCEHLDLRLANRKVLESLVKAGACDSMGPSRASLLAAIDQALEEAAVTQQDKQKGQMTFFEAMSASQPSTPAAPQMTMAREWPESQKLAFEKTLLGFYVSGHPLARFERTLKALATSTSKDLPALPADTAVTVGGILSKIKLTTTKKRNEQMAVCVLEDMDGETEVLVFPAVFPQLAPQLKPNAIVFVEGRVSSRNDQPRLIANQIVPMEQSTSRLAKAVELVLRTPSVERELLEQLKGLLAKFPGSLPIYLTLHAPEEPPTRLKLAEGFRIEPSPELLEELERLLGTEGVILQRQPHTTPARPAFRLS